MASKLIKFIPLFLILSNAVFAQIAPRSVVQRAARYALILEDEPVATRFATREAMQTTAGADYRRQIETVHANLRSDLANRSFTVTGSVTTSLNAIFVLASPSRVAELEALRGVRAVVQLRSYQRLLNRAMPLLDAPPAWSAVGGVSNAGAGVKIAIIDSGIDQTHAAFQDSSLSMPAGFPKCTPGDCTFTNNKVIVARSYIKMVGAGSDPKNPAADSRPDDFTARDHGGHGTAVASAAAGNITSGLVNFNGMAPKAYLGSYKIFGSPGVNGGTSDDAIIAALDDAINDGMDIISFSVGGEAFSGSQDTGAACGLAAGVACDMLAVAFENAAKAGMVIVASAGNDGFFGLSYPSFNTIQTPSSTPDVISVGASTNSHFFAETIGLPGNVPANLQNISGQSGDANTFYPQGAFTLPLLDMQQIGDDGTACNTQSAGALYGFFVLIKRGGCTYATKIQNVQDAGAFGAIIYMDTNGAPVAPNDPFDDPNLIPFIVIRNADGVNLKTYVDANPLPLATFNTAGSEQINNADADELAGFSSLGPSTGDSLIKPDLVATGTQIYTAAQTYDPQGEVYSYTGFAAVDGTSLSTPLVAGAAAIIKQLHPKWTVAQIRSALINNAAENVSTDDNSNGSFLNVDIQSFGAGLLDVGASASATVTASPVSLSFGIKPTLPLTKTITLTNNGASSVTLAISTLASNGALGGATVAFDKTSVTLGAGASAPLNVTISGTLPPPNEYSAFVEIKGAGVDLRVPYMYIVPDRTPANLFQVGGGFDGLLGEAVDVRNLAVKLTDDFGAPIANSPVTFSAPDGGKILNPPAMTDQFGIATAQAVLGSSPGFYSYLVDAGGMELQFNGFARLAPAVTSVENAASFDTTAPVAPGSYMSILGANLSDFTDRTIFARLPLSIDGVSVSFDVPAAGISVPGHVSYVSATQINVQVPWELAGQKSALMKVSLSSAIGNVFTVPIADYAPAFFEIGAAQVAAEDSGYAIITTSHPAKRGDSIALYANGLGPVSNRPASGDPSPSDPAKLAQTPTLPTVTFIDSTGAKTNATVVFSGLTPQIAGLYQVNVTVPSSLAPGTYGLTMTIGGVTSKASGIVVQ
jgi:minor extracellular serine protease Vpr